MPLPRGARLFERASEPLDVIVYFSDERANLERRVPVLAGFLAQEGFLWCLVPDTADHLRAHVVPRLALCCELLVDESREMTSGWIGTLLIRKGRREQSSAAEME
jgi:hypothetical protein